MIKKSLIVFFAFLFVVVSINAQSFLTIKGGISNLSGEDSEYWKSGYNFAAEYAYMFSRYSVLGIGGIFTKFPFDGDKFVKDYGFEGTGLSYSGDGYISGIYFLGRAYLYNEKTISFYIQTSVGYYSIKSNYSISYLGTIIYNSEDYSESKIGTEFSAGIAFGGQKVKFVITPSYFLIKDNNFFTINGGIQLYF